MGTKQSGATMKNESSSTTEAREVRTDWVERWKDVIAAETVLPGVWRRQAGGFHVRGRVIDPRTGKMREVNRELPNMSRAKDAFRWLQTELDKIRAGAVTEARADIPSLH